MSRRSIDEAIVAPRPRTLVAVAAAAVAGCPPSGGVWEAARKRPVVVLVGDFMCPSAASILDELRSRGVEVYAVTGRRDDTFIADLVASRASLIDGKLVELGGGVYLAGVGGREPLMNIERLSTSLGGLPPGATVILASYYPPHGVLDSSRLGPGRGLYELRALVEHLPAGVRVVVAASDCGPRGAIAPLAGWRGYTVCLHSIAEGDGCVHLLGAAEPPARSCSGGARYPMTEGRSGRGS